MWARTFNWRGPKHKSCHSIPEIKCCTHTRHTWCKKVEPLAVVHNFSRTSYSGAGCDTDAQQSARVVVVHTQEEASKSWLL